MREPAVQLSPSPQFGSAASILRWPAVLCLLAFVIACVSLPAQQPYAIAHDPTPEAQAPTQNIETVIDSHGSRITGMLLLASGIQPHRTVILLHGFPGYEQNMDLAQALRRDGWNVLAMHYRGTWGSQGAFSFTHCMEDVGAMLAYLSDPANTAKFHVDRRRIVVIGHSMGGFLAVAAMAQHRQIAAGVVISEGSPIINGPGFFGKKSDPADYVPLAGTSPAALRREAQAHAAAWSFATLAAKIAPRPILDVTADDGLRASNDALVAALTHAGARATSLHMDTDHDFTDHRIALEAAVLAWLDKTVE
ncbi:MAG TPA: alpha/beta fold hydrolase [Acidobacteriaceae bacterium]|nr:alpha/beta fold hydrolase [Acidobacteriaceae bacterium]